MNPWGLNWRTRNLFQEYFTGIVKASEDEDWLGCQELWDELTTEQKWDIYGRLASYTKRVLKENCNFNISV